MPRRTIIKTHAHTRVRSFLAWSKNDQSQYRSIARSIAVLGPKRIRLTCGQLATHSTPCMPLLTYQPITVSERLRGYKNSIMSFTSVLAACRCHKMRRDRQLGQSHTLVSLELSLPHLCLSLLPSRSNCFSPSSLFYRNFSLPVYGSRLSIILSICLFHSLPPFPPYRCFFC